MQKHYLFIRNRLCIKGVPIITNILTTHNLVFTEHGIFIALNIVNALIRSDSADNIFWYSSTSFVGILLEEQMEHTRIIQELQSHLVSPVGILQ